MLVARGVIEVVDLMRLDASGRGGRVGRQCQRNTIPPAAHQFRGDELGAHVVALAGHHEELLERRNVLFEHAECSVGGVVGELRRQATNEVPAVLIDVIAAEQELTGLGRRLHVGRLLSRNALDPWPAMPSS